MKKVIIFLTAIFLFACATSNYVKVQGSQVIITNFNWGISRIGINQIDGDFELLNKEVFDALEGYSGIFSIKLVYNNIEDQYGNATSNEYTIGTIDATELNKYQDFSYWVKETGGLSAKFTEEINSQPAEVLNEKQPSETNNSESQSTSIKEISELLFNPDELRTFDSNGKPFTGIGVDFGLFAISNRTEVKYIDGYTYEKTLTTFQGKVMSITKYDGKGNVTKETLYNQFGDIVSSDEWKLAW